MSKKKKQNKNDDNEENSIDWPVSNIYDDEQREEMLESDQITEEEFSFMEGWEKKKTKYGKTQEHRDSASVLLAEEEYKED